MTLEDNVMQALKQAMKDKDQAAMRTLRAIKSAILLFKTSGSGEVLNKEAEIKLLQKLVKQRKDSATIYHEQNRPELATTEEEEIAILEKFLPAQLSPDELRAAITEIIKNAGASGPKDMGKVIGAANIALAGRAEGKAIAAMTKELLNI